MVKFQSRLSPYPPPPGRIALQGAPSPLGFGDLLYIGPGAEARGPSSETEKRKSGFRFAYWEEGKNILAQNAGRSVCCFLFQSAFCRCSPNMFFAVCGIIIHPHLNRPSQVLRSAMPTAPEDGVYLNCCWMKSDRIVSKLSFISKGRTYSTTVFTMH